MTETPEKKVGIISCSGEECVEGTISRVATRLVLGKLRPNETVTICLPLFLAGGREEREFARDYPTITVDGCDKMCAKVATERLQRETSLINCRNRLDEELAMSETQLSTQAGQRNLDSYQKSC